MGQLLIMPNIRSDVLLTGFSKHAYVKKLRLPLIARFWLNQRKEGCHSVKNVPPDGAGSVTEILRMRHWRQYIRVRVETTRMH